MANAREEAFRAEGHAAFVVGYTGEVGKELVKVRGAGWYTWLLRDVALS
jgi:hypothetical protein